MPYKFDYPVNLPRYTSEEFELKRAEYVAKNGYEIHIPNFQDIVHYKWNPEPSRQDLDLYHNKDVNALGQARFDQIAGIMADKRERFQRILASPVPGWINNIGATMTFLDDINDAMGTLGVITRTAAHLAPAALARFLTGPAGWAFTAAEIAGMGMSLSRLPFKSKRIQHTLHDQVKDNPFSKKARLKRLDKLKRLSLSKGEIIEGLQSTDNVFGFGLCLGPIVGLIYDIAAGLVRHVQGKEVKIYGLPKPLVWFDQAWSRALQGAATMFMDNTPFEQHWQDRAIMVCNMASQVAQSVTQNTPIMDILPEPENLETRAPQVRHSTTADILREFGRDPTQPQGYPWNSKEWYKATGIWDDHQEEVTANVQKWYDRNRNDLAMYAAGQNAVQAGQNILALLAGKEDVETDFDGVSQALLKLMNEQYRFPAGIEEEQGLKWAHLISQYEKTGIPITTNLARQIARESCGFDFTTRIEGREQYELEARERERVKGIERLKEWYYKEYVEHTAQDDFVTVRSNHQALLDHVQFIDRYELWLNKYGYPEGHPTAIDKIWLNYHRHQLQNNFQMWGEAELHLNDFYRYRDMIDGHRPKYSPNFLLAYAAPPTISQFIAVIASIWIPTPFWADPLDALPQGADEDTLLQWALRIYG